MAAVEEGAKGGFRWWLLVLVLVLIATAFVGGLLTRPSLEQRLLSSEDSRTDGEKLKQRVEQALVQLEQRQRQEAMRLSSQGSKYADGSVSSLQFAEYDRLGGLIRDLTEFKAALARAEEGGWQSLVVRTLKPVIEEKLTAVEPSKSK